MPRKSTSYVHGWPDGIAYLREIETSARQNRLIELVQACPRTRKELMALTGASRPWLCQDVIKLKDAGVFQEGKNGIISITPIKGIRSCATK